MASTTPVEMAAFDEIQVLREYLESTVPPVCRIILHIPETHLGTAQTLGRIGVPVSLVKTSNSSASVEAALKDEVPAELKALAATAFTCDADIVVVREPRWFPYAPEFDELLKILLADVGVLKRHCELFVRGHDTPWAFNQQIWGSVWTTFYPVAEERSFRDGVKFLYQADKSNLDLTIKDAARMLVYNRVVDLCFTRDRLLFIDMQQSAAKRAKWQRQGFSFEAAYYLNFFYLLIYGGFDHIASVVNGVLGLGVSERGVGATYRTFLEALQAKDARIHGYFTEPGTVDFIKRIAALRHLTAHRGSIRPTVLYKELEKEPTNEELDNDIETSGQRILLPFFPDGEIRESVRALLRFSAKMKRHEKLADGVVFVQTDSERYFVNPMYDIEWNFDKFHSFMVKVLRACTEKLQI
jgi:hypothetical protein